LLKPKLIDLVDCDEEQLVMFRTIAERLLQLKKFINF